MEIWDIMSGEYESFEVINKLSMGQTDLKSFDIFLNEKEETILAVFNTPFDQEAIYYVVYDFQGNVKYDHNITFDGPSSDCFMEYTYDALSNDLYVSDFNNVFLVDLPTGSLQKVKSFSTKMSVYSSLYSINDGKEYLFCPDDEKENVLIVKDLNTQSTLAKVSLQFCPTSIFAKSDFLYTVQSNPGYSDDVSLAYIDTKSYSYKVYGNPMSRDGTYIAFFMEGGIYGYFNSSDNYFYGMNIETQEVKFKSKQEIKNFELNWALLRRSFTDYSASCSFTLPKEPEIKINTPSGPLFENNIKSWTDEAYGYVIGYNSVTLTKEIGNPSWVLSSYSALSVMGMTNGTTATTYFPNEISSTGIFFPNNLDFVYGEGELLGEVWHQGTNYDSFIKFYTFDKSTQKFSQVGETWDIPSNDFEGMVWNEKEKQFIGFDGINFFFWDYVEKKRIAVPYMGGVGNVNIGDYSPIVQYDPTTNTSYCFMTLSSVWASAVDDDDNEQQSANNKKKSYRKNPSNSVSKFARFNLNIEQGKVYGEVYSLTFMDMNGFQYDEKTKTVFTVDRDEGNFYVFSDLFAEPFNQTKKTSVKQLWRKYEDTKIWFYDDGIVYYADEYDPNHLTGYDVLNDKQVFAATYKNGIDVTSLGVKAKIIQPTL